MKLSTARVIGASLAAALAIVCDFGAGHAVYGSGILAEAMDIASPDTYLAKLNMLHRHRGLRVALVGDSQVVGEAMRDHGDAAWREHTLDRALEHQLRATAQFEGALVVSLGANGLLP